MKIHGDFRSIMMAVNKGNQRQNIKTFLSQSSYGEGLDCSLCSYTRNLNILKKYCGLHTDDYYYWCYLLCVALQHWNEEGERGCNNPQDHMMARMVLKEVTEKWYLVMSRVERDLCILPAPILLCCPLFYVFYFSLSAFPFL